MVRTDGIGTATVRLAEDSDPSEYLRVYNDGGWVTLIHGVTEERQQEDGTNFTVYKTKKRISIPANRVYDIVEEYEDKASIS